jgi:glycosyltransferase involved in cell wall biosynthesis
MRIAIAKGDYKIVGGFEIVVDRLVAGLRERGHTVDLAIVDATADEVSHLPVAVGKAARLVFREFFFHLNMIARFAELDVTGYDAVLCTQPGSYAVRHPRKVALFYHHARSFYDLQPIIERARGHDADLHQLAAFIVRDVDAFYLTPDLPILAGSRRVKERLARYNRLTDSVEVFSAGIDEIFLNYAGPITFESPVCVGRHEFPKRPELFVHAMHHVRGLQGRVLGVGSFTDRIQGLDAWLALKHRGPAAESDCGVNDAQLWLDDVVHLPAETLHQARRDAAATGAASPVRFLGRVSQAQLLEEYAAALCVVCPAYDEDFGLTCVEAMAVGKPVIACRDGGSYAELIDDGVDGFLVDPTGPAIAAAIDRLRVPDVARVMGERGRRKAAAFTWPRAIDQVEQALGGRTPFPQIRA